MDFLQCHHGAHVVAEVQDGFVLADDADDEFTIDLAAAQDCPQVEGVTLECEDDGTAVVDLGDVEGVTGITVDGAPVEVPGDGVLELDLPEGDHEVVVSRADADAITLVVDCGLPAGGDTPDEEQDPEPETEVLGVTLDQGDEDLAATGVSTTGLLLAALAVLGLGAVVVGATRSRPQR